MLASTHLRDGPREGPERVKARCLKKTPGSKPTSRRPRPGEEPLARLLYSKQGREGETARARAQDALSTGWLPRLTPRREQRAGLQHSSLAGETRREEVASQEIPRPWRKGS